MSYTITYCVYLPVLISMPYNWKAVLEVYGWVVEEEEVIYFLRYDTNIPSPHPQSKILLFVLVDRHHLARSSMWFSEAVDTVIEAWRLLRNVAAQSHVISCKVLWTVLSVQPCFCSSSRRISLCRMNAGAVSRLFALREVNCHASISA